LDLLWGEYYMNGLADGLLLLMLLSLIHLEVQSALTRRDIKRLQNKICPDKSKKESEE